MSTFVILGGTGGVLAALTAIVVIGRGIFRQVNATEDNTKALTTLNGRIEALSQTTNGHETRLAVLEDRAKREARH